MDPQQVTAFDCPNPPSRNPVIIRSETHVYRITFDGHDYRVTHAISAKSKWHDGGEAWQVIVTHNDRMCDPTKPTFKRVVAAMKEALDTI